MEHSKQKAKVSYQLSKSYDIFIGRNSLDDFVSHLATLRPIDKIFIITDAVVNEIGANHLEAKLISRGFKTIKYVLQNGTGRKHKTLKTVDNILRLMFQSDADKNSIIINVGGGVVGDIGGLVAALYLRGIRYIHFPTTLLSQVDSSIGGKVGVNFEKYLNGVGRMYVPELVWIDTIFLDTLPDVEFNSGLSEVVKYATILDPELFSFIDIQKIEIKTRNQNIIENIIRHCVEKKAQIVTNDPTEIFDFMLFTYGHEIGHALEVLFNYQDLRHGEAISIGMQGSAWLSSKLAISNSPELQTKQKQLLDFFDLPSKIPLNFLGEFNRDDVSDSLVNIIMKDKKRENQRVIWVLPVKIGQGICTDQISIPLISECLDTLL